MQPSVKVMMALLASSELLLHGVLANGEWLA
jgi:hypothetical protein